MLNHTEKGFEMATMMGSHGHDKHMMAYSFENSLRFSVVQSWYWGCPILYVLNVLMLKNT